MCLYHAIPPRTIRRFCIIALLALAPLLTTAAPKPNIVFILADDLGYADIGFNGSHYFETPHIDALAENSLALDYAYAYPTCSPSRAALLTGKHSFRTGVYNVPVLEQNNAKTGIFSRWTVLKEHAFYSQLLQTAGYNTIHLGKWHVVGPYPRQELAQAYPFKKKLRQPRPGDYSWVTTHKTADVQRYYPTGRGFHENVGGTFRGDPAFETGGYRSETGGYRAPFSNPFVAAKKGDEWLTDRLTDDAIDFIKRHSKAPFFINLHYYAPHRPSIARSETSFKKYMAKPADPTTGQGEGDLKKRKETAAYATMVESIDQNVGRIIDVLDQSGLRENTLIIFSSDNGFNGIQSANKGLRGSKGNVYEGGIRIPCLINWPGQITPRRSTTPVSLLDFFPTFLTLAGAEPGSTDGDSLVPLFKGDNALQDRPLFWHIASRFKDPPCSIIRKNDYKLIQFLNDGRLELYHLKDDPTERNNLAAKKPEIRNRLKTELVEWRKTHRVPLPPASELPH